MEKALLIMFAFGLLLFAGCVTEPTTPVTPPVEPEPVPEPEPEPEPQPEPEETLTMEEAKAIAEASSCMNDGNLTGTSMYNDVTKTWWFDMDVEKPGCSPACVVDETTKTAEINWRCTGLLPENETEETPAAYDTEEKCTAAGGVWTPDSKGVENCYFETSDAGTSCTSSDQCESYCVSTAPFATTGICYTYKTLNGCWFVIDDGKANEVCN